MSYDLRLGVKVEGTGIMVVVAEPEYASPTYNLGQMFRACTGWDFQQGKWYKVSDVWENINHGISELRMYPQKYKTLEPDNGWGTVSSAILALESLRDCIEQTANGDWRGDEAIPLEYLWVKW